MRTTLILVFLLQILLGSSQNSDQLEKIRIYTGWYHQFQFAGYYAAKELGYYNEAGLDVDLIEYDGTFSPGSIASGKYEYGIGSASQVFESEKRDDLLIVAPIFQQSPVALITRRDAGIEILKDFEGKKISTGLEMKSMLFLAGVDLNQVEFKGNSTNLELINSGDFSAVTHYITDFLRNETEYKIFRPLEYGVNFYGECLFTTQKEFELNPERVKNIRRATIRGWEYAAKNPDQVIDWIINKYGSKLTVDQLQEEAAVVINSQLITSMFPVGFSDINKWTHISNTLSLVNRSTEIVDLEKLIYSPEIYEGSWISKGIVKWILIIISALSLLVTGLVLYSRHLSSQVQKRTIRLEIANNQIQVKNELLSVQKKELESLNSFKDQLLSVISHDVRNPLISMKSFLELIDSGVLTQEQMDLISKEEIAKINSVEELLDNLLIWFKRQMTVKSHDLEKLDLSLIINHAISFSEYLINAKSIKIVSNIPDKTFVLGDNEILKLVIRNVISNALKFSHEGGTVNIDLTNAEGLHPVLQISDSGIGMSPEYLQNLFLSPKTSRTGTGGEKGTGLAMKLCKEFMLSSGGDIWAESTQGVGSTFFIKLNKE